MDTSTEKLLELALHEAERAKVITDAYLEILDIKGEKLSVDSMVILASTATITASIHHASACVCKRLDRLFGGGFDPNSN